MSERSAESVIWDFLRGALMTRVLAIVADLGVANSLADGSRSVKELAQEAGVDSDVLHRILRALASDGVFAEEERGVFRNTEASELLRAEGWSDFAHLFGVVWHRAAGELDASGSASFPAVFGTDFWSWLAEHPAERASFDRAMVQGWEDRIDRLERRDWRGDETVVDVGGGNGSLLVGLLRRRPGLRGIVFDLPETVRDESTFGDRIQFVEGSFFERVPEGDVFILSTILHDWDDAAAGRILETIHACAPRDARLIVLDAVLPRGGKPNWALWLDLLVLALFAGKERDEGEWHALLTGVGFEPVRIVDGLIEARCR